MTDIPNFEQQPEQFEPGEPREAADLSDAGSEALPSDGFTSSAGRDEAHTDLPPPPHPGAPRAAEPAEIVPTETTSTFATEPASSPESTPMPGEVPAVTAEAQIQAPADATDTPEYQDQPATDGDPHQHLLDALVDGKAHNLGFFNLVADLDLGLDPALTAPPEPPLPEPLTLRTVHEFPKLPLDDPEAVVAAQLLADGCTDAFRRFPDFVQNNGDRPATLLLRYASPTTTERVLLEVHGDGRLNTTTQGGGLVDGQESLHNDYAPDNGTLTRTHIDPTTVLAGLPLPTEVSLPEYEAAVAARMAEHRHNVELSQQLGVDGMGVGLTEVSNVLEMLSQAQPRLFDFEALAQTAEQRITVKQITIAAGELLGEEPIPFLTYDECKEGYDQLVEAITQCLDDPDFPEQAGYGTSQSAYMLTLYPDWTKESHLSHPAQLTTRPSPGATVEQQKMIQTANGEEELRTIIDFLPTIGADGEQHLRIARHSMIMGSGTVKGELYTGNTIESNHMRQLMATIKYLRAQGQQQPPSH